MSNEEKKLNALFLQLVLSLQSAAWYQMGKIISPVSGKIEKNLDEAKVSIDLLTMLQEKTKNNLSEEEKKIIDNTIFTLQMNYIDEVNQEREHKGNIRTGSGDKASSEMATPAGQEGLESGTSENK